MSFDTILASVVSGGGIGVLYGLVGYGNSWMAAHKRGEYLSFDLVDIGTTVIVSALIGALASFSGLSEEAIANGAFGVVATQFIKKILKIVTR